MLPLKNRLTLEKEIITSLRSRFNASDGNFRLVLSRSKQKNFRFCFIVSKKVFKRANKRNRIRRRVKAQIKSLLDLKQFKLQYFNGLIQCQHKNALKLSSEKLGVSISNLLKLTLEKVETYKQKNFVKNTTNNNGSPSWSSKPVIQSEKLQVSKPD